MDTVSAGNTTHVGTHKLTNFGYFNVQEAVKALKHKTENTKVLTRSTCLLCLASYESISIFIPSDSSLNTQYIH